ncbi:hypothetical protein Tco_1000668 [Tanacetum coccineum]
MCYRAVDVIPGLLRARNELKEDPGEQVLLMREKDAPVKKLKKLVVLSFSIVAIQMYKNQMIELYLALNPDERYQYVQQTRLQDSFEMLQDEYEVYQADMEFKLYEARK